MDDIKPINPGQTFNIGSSDSLIQVQHKGNRVEIVTHLDKGFKPVDCHFVTTINKDGKISSKY
jgi:hypothetical protein